jgi:hypothetical protein
LTDGTVVTNAEHSASTPNDTSFFTTSASDARYFRQDSTETIFSGDTWSSSDSRIASTAAIDARIIDLVDDVGGFVPIANETSFPLTNPDINNPDGAGTIISIKEISTSRTPSSGIVTITNGAGTNTVTINGCGSTVLAAGFGVLVETTSTLHTYTFHRLVPKATEVTTVAGISSDVTTVATNSANVTAVASNAANVNTVAGSIANVNNVGGSIANVNSVASNLNTVNDFAARYRVSSTDPTTSLDTGDLVFNTTNNELRVFNGTAWQGGVTATGNLVSKSGDTLTGPLGITAGTAALPSLFISGDPNTGAFSPGADQLSFTTGGTERLSISAAGAVNVPGALTKGGNNVVTVGDTGTITSTMVADGTLVNADVNASAAIAGTKISPDFGSQNTTTTGTSTAASFIPTSSTAPTNGVYLPSANNVAISTNGTGRLFIASDGRVSVGTSSVAANIHSHAANNQFLARDSATNDSLFISVDNGVADINTFLSTTARMPLRFVQYTSEVARFDSSGRLGLGTSTPQAVLTTKASTGLSTAWNTFTGDGLQFDATGATVANNEYGPGISWARNGANNTRVAAISSVQTGADSDLAGLAFFTHGSTDNTQPISERLRITGAGLVGIGTTSPGESLEVNGNISLSSNPGSFRLIGAANSSDTTVLLQGGAASGQGGNIELSRTGDIFLDGTTHRFRNLSGASEYARIDSSGRLLVGTSSSVTALVNAGIQAHGTAGQGYINSGRWSNDGNRSELIFSKSRGGAVGTRGIVQNNDGVGGITFTADDGTNFLGCAQILAEVDGTPGANDMPGRLVFSTTADGASSPTERFRINNAGSFSAVVPSGSTLYPAFWCRAWVNFNGTGTVAIRDSGNVSSITDNGTGDYTVNFTTALADANYSSIASCGEAYGTATVVTAINSGGGEVAPTTSSMRMEIKSPGSGSKYDVKYINVAIFR